MNYHDECARRSRINRVIRDMMPVIPNARRYRYGIVHPDYRTHSVIWWTPKDRLWRMMARNSRGLLFEALTTPDANIARRIFADTWGSE
jgi:hypothetical protein